MPQLHNLTMKFCLLFVMVALATARPDGETRKPKPEKPAVFIKVDKFHNATQGETYQFQFGVAGVEQLDQTKVNLWKVEKGKRRPVFKKTDFEITLKSVSGEEMGDCPFKTDDSEERDEDAPVPTNAILGSVSVLDMSCKDQGLYLVHYGNLPRPGPKPRLVTREKKDGEEDKAEKLKKVPGLFVIKVEGCKRSEA